MRNIVISNRGDRFMFARNVHVGTLMKSETARAGNMVETRMVRLEQVGKSEMTAEERYIAGGCFMAMLPREVTLYSTPETKQAIRERLLKSENADACAEFDAGRGRESDVLKALDATEKAGGEEMDRDEEGNAILGEPMRKGVDTGLFDLTRKGAGREIVEAAYGAYLKKGQDGASALAEAAAELDALVARLGR